MKPPFRADQVGSLLRPAVLAAARAQFKEGALSAEALRQVEDDSIRRIVEKQQSIGAAFHHGWRAAPRLLAHRLSAAARRRDQCTDTRSRFGGTEEQPPMAVSQAGWAVRKPIMVDAFVYLQSLTGTRAAAGPQRATAKVAIPPFPRRRCCTSRADATPCRAPFIRI